MIENLSYKHCISKIVLRRLLHFQFESHSFPNIDSISQASKSSFPLTKILLITKFKAEMFLKVQKYILLLLCQKIGIAILKLELWVTSLSDTPCLQYYDVQTLEYRYISKCLVGVALTRYMPPFSWKYKLNYLPF